MQNGLRSIIGRAMNYKLSPWKAQTNVNAIVNPNQTTEVHEQNKQDEGSDITNQM